MNDKIDFGYSAALDRLNNWISESSEFLNKNLNETETRNKIIDPLFKQVMGWSEKQISREDYINEIGYYDYEFRCNNNTFILEAKREFVEFSMPNSNFVTASSLKSKYSRLKEAINQGVNYAVPRNIKVVVVSNGSQIAVTFVPYFHTPGNDTYLFQGHEKIFHDFINFYNLFSPFQNIENSLVKLLSSEENLLLRNRPAFSHKISMKQDNPSDVLPNNNLATFLGSIHDRYFTEIINDWELLKKCYCDYDGAHQYEKNIEFILRDRAPRLSRVVEDVTLFEEERLELSVKEAENITDIRTTKKTADIFDDHFTESRNKSKMFLLIGGAGVGKTTFIHRFFNFILSQEDKESTVWIYLDCKECANDTNLDTFIYQKVEDELYDKYSDLNLFEEQNVLLSIFSNDLNKKKALLTLLPKEQQDTKKFEIIQDIINKDKETYIKRIFEYLQKTGYSTCIVYDNVDQLDTELQKRLFLHGNAVKERLRTTLILSLREEVYYQHENDKTFNFSDCEVFHIPAPKVYNVLAKRLRAAKEEFDEDEMLFDIKNSKGISVILKKLDIIEVLTQTFLGNTENTLLIEMLTNGDVRESLKLFKRIISSSNVNYDDLLSAAGGHSVKTSIDKRLKNEELLRALALDNRVHYSSSKSKIINIFDINNDGFFSHFTKLRILRYAETNLSLTVGTLPKGFFRLKNMYDEVFRYTVKNIESFNDICLYLQKEGALINLKGTISDLNNADFISLGPTGYYYLNHLINNPQYLALVSIDTPIADSSVAERIDDLYKKSKTTQSEYQKNKRYEDMAESFINYLVESEKEEMLNLDERACPNLDSPLYNISENIREKIISIRV
ncbi:hypothetical protein [Paenibacillus sp. SN-8-1]|uniref:hypothetical protein n=1 Tax=Paenibacillus sp. SN-8-1 TaxID=3435409 RepID=UPI003D9AA91D